MTVTGTAELKMNNFKLHLVPDAFRNGAKMNFTRREGLQMKEYQTRLR